MAKMFITGSARSPSTEEFKQRIARLAEMPTHTAPANARKNRPAKPAFPQPKPGADEAQENDAHENESREPEADGAADERD